MTKLFMSPRELEAEQWTGENLEQIETLCEGRGPGGEMGCKTELRRAAFTSEDQVLPQLTHTLRVWTGNSWLDVLPGWWVVQMENGAMSRMSPDYVRLYTHPEPPSELKMYYDAFQAAQHRLMRVATGVEQLAMEMGRTDPRISRYLQDRLRQLLCVHPEGGMRHGHAESWCSVCFKRMEPGDINGVAREMMAHVVTWCRCDTTKCAVHDKAKKELPLPATVGTYVPAIPESTADTDLVPTGEITPIRPAVLTFDDGETVTVNRWDLAEILPEPNDLHESSPRFQLSGWLGFTGMMNDNPKRIIREAEVPGEPDFPVGHKVTVETERREHRGVYVKVWWRK